MTKVALEIDANIFSGIHKIRLRYSCSQEVNIEFLGNMTGTVSTCQTVILSLSDKNVLSSIARAVEASQVK